MAKSTTAKTKVNANVQANSPETLEMLLARLDELEAKNSALVDTLATRTAELQAANDCINANRTLAKTYTPTVALYAIDETPSNAYKDCVLILVDTSKISSLLKGGINLFSREYKGITRVTSKITTGLESREVVYNCYRMFKSEFERLLAALSYHYNGAEKEIFQQVTFDILKREGEGAFKRALSKRNERATTGNDIIKDDYTVDDDIKNSMLVDGGILKGTL